MRWLALLASLLVCACAQSQTQRIAPGQPPALDSVEGGMWMVMERAERRLVTSGRLVQDEALQRYVNEIVCRLSQKHCDDIRVYVVRRPEFNAWMAPNGFMVLWSGLLLRVDNEAQLAAVIGHEVAHYLERHALQRWDAAQTAINTATALNFVAALAGLAPVGLLIDLITAGHLAAYSREQERESDALGLDFMQNAGYSGGESVVLWRNLTEERDAAELDKPEVFLASHPPSEERTTALEALAKARVGGDLGMETFRRHTDPHLATWLEDEIDLGRFARLQSLLVRFKRDERALPLMWHYQGELYRRRAEEADLPKAVEALTRAVEYGPALATTYRSLALAHWENGNRVAARDAFQSYLQADAKANDREMIEHYLDELEK